MTRALLIADDDTRWPVEVRPPAVLVRTDRFLKVRIGLVHEYLSLIREVRPDVIHADGPAAVRAVRVASVLTRFAFSAPRPKVIASGITMPPDWFTRLGLRSANRVIARTMAEANLYQSLGLTPTRIPFGVKPVTPPEPTAFRRSLDIPEAARLVMAAGSFDTDAGMKTAVWAFDVLKYAAPDLHLVLIGDGPERERLSRFAKALGFDDFRVRFTGARQDASALLGLAEIVWVTHSRGGVELALAAMAAGRPVIAARTPDLAEVIEDGVMGRLVDATDRVRLAAITNELLEKPELAHSLATAGQRRVVEQFPASEVGKRFADVYRGVS